MSTETADSGCVLHLTTFLPSHGSTRPFFKIFLCTRTHTHTRTHKQVCQNQTHQMKSV